jgi:hypothetical protein
MLVRLPARVTIPIDNRPCFSHRFSPKGFNLNASEISLPLPDPSALAFRLKPILTVLYRKLTRRCPLRYVSATMPWYIARTCPKCRDDFWIVVNQPPHSNGERPINAY